MTVRSAVQRVDHQARKKEVVDREALGRNLLVKTAAILGMYFRQENQVVLVRNSFQLAEVFPGAGPVEEIDLPGFLVQIGECIQPYQPAAVVTQLFQGLV